MLISIMCMNLRMYACTYGCMLVCMYVDMFNSIFVVLFIIYGNLRSGLFMQLGNYNNNGN